MDDEGGKKATCRTAPAEGQGGGEEPEEGRGDRKGGNTHGRWQTDTLGTLAPGPERWRNLVT